MLQLMYTKTKHTLDSEMDSVQQRIKSDSEEKRLIENNVLLVEGCDIGPPRKGGVRGFRA